MSGSSRIAGLQQLLVVASRSRRTGSLAMIASGRGRGCVALSA